MSEQIEQRAPGRPSIFSEEIADTICERLIEGDSMRQICKRQGMPNRSTVLRWMDGDSSFAARCARARMLQADLMDDLILETARNCTTETAPAARVKIAAYQWRAEKLEPKKYGPRVALDHSGAVAVKGGISGLLAAVTDGATSEDASAADEGGGG